MKAYIVPIAIFATAVAGCASVGKHIEQADVEKIVVGKTTKEEMFVLFGKPLTQSFSSEGKLSMTWFYTYVGAFGSGMQQQTLLVMFNDDGTVNKYSMIDGGHDGVKLGR